MTSRDWAQIARELYDMQEHLAGIQQRMGEPEHAVDMEELRQIALRRAGQALVGEIKAGVA